MENSNSFLMPLRPMTDILFDVLLPLPYGARNLRAGTLRWRWRRSCRTRRDLNGDYPTGSAYAHAPGIGVLRICYRLRQVADTLPYIPIPKCFSMWGQRH